jgi:hypothetical protein
MQIEEEPDEELREEIERDRRELAHETHRQLAALSDVVPLIPVDASVGRSLNDETGEMWELRESLAQELFILGAHEDALRLIVGLPPGIENGEPEEHAQCDSLFQSLVEDLADKRLFTQAREFIARRTTDRIEKVDLLICVGQRSQDPIDFGLARKLLVEIEHEPKETYMNRSLIVQRYMLLWRIAQDPADMADAVRLTGLEDTGYKVDAQLSIARYTGKALDYLKAFAFAQRTGLETRALYLDQIVTSITHNYTMDATMSMGTPYTVHFISITDETLEEIFRVIPNRFRAAIIKRIRDMGGKI